jgi:hypothetical protein
MSPNASPSAITPAVGRRKALRAHRRRLAHNADAAQRHARAAEDLSAIGGAVPVTEALEQVVARFDDDRQPVGGLLAAVTQSQKHQRRGQPAALASRVADPAR